MKALLLMIAAFVLILLCSSEAFADAIIKALGG